MIFTEPIVLFISLYTSFNYAILFGFFDAFPVVFGGVYEFDTHFTGLTFPGIGFGCVVAVATAIIVNRAWFHREHVKSHSEGRSSVVAPDHRLYVAMMGSFGLPIGLFVCLDGKSGRSLNKSHTSNHSFCLGQSMCFHCCNSISSRCLRSSEQCFGSGCQRLC